MRLLFMSAVFSENTCAELEAEKQAYWRALDTQQDYQQAYRTLGTDMNPIFSSFSRQTKIGRVSLTECSSTKCQRDRLGPRGARWSRCRSSCPRAHTHERPHTRTCTLTCRHVLQACLAGMSLRSCTMLTLTRGRTMVITQSVFW